MEIKQKGGSATLESLKQLMVKMSWSSAADFDLAAIYKDKTGKKGMVYFSELGNLQGYPYMKLSGDAGVGDSVDSGGNEETMRITSLEEMSEVHLIVWDYGAVQSGSTARFQGSDVKVSVIDDKNNSNEVDVDTGDMGNVLVLAKIDNSSPMGAQLINESKIGTLKGLSNSDQLWAIAEAA